MIRFSPTNTFSTARFIHLCKMEFILNQRQWFIGLLASTGIVIVIWMLPTLLITMESGVNQYDYLLHSALMIFTLWGLLLTSDIFQELSTPSTAFKSLTLPATSSEKFLVAWLITMPVFVFVTVSAIFLITLLSSLLFMIFDGSSGFNIYNPFDETTGKFALTYLFLNSLFLFGAVYFRKNNFLKTIVAFIAIIISYLILWNLLGSLYHSLFEPDLFLHEFITGDPQNNIFGSISRWVITSTALLLTYVSLKKQQVV